MRKLVLISILVLAVAALAITSDYKVTSSTEVSVIGYTGADVIADGGSATVIFTTWVGDTVRDTVRTHYLLDNVPRTFTWQPNYDGVDTMIVVPAGADTIIYTLR